MYEKENERKNVNRHRRKRKGKKDLNRNVEKGSWTKVFKNIHKKTSYKTAENQWKKFNATKRKKRN